MHIYISRLVRILLTVFDTCVLVSNWPTHDALNIYFFSLIGVSLEVQYAG